jgi:hypothetical protein
MILIPPLLFLRMDFNTSLDTQPQKEGLDILRQTAAARGVVDRRISTSVPGNPDAPVRRPEVPQEPADGSLRLLKDTDGNMLFVGAQSPGPKPLQPLRDCAPAIVGMVACGGQIDLEPSPLPIYPRLNLMAEDLGSQPGDLLREVLFTSGVLDGMARQGTAVSDQVSQQSQLRVRKGLLSRRGDPPWQCQMLAAP